MYPKIIHQIWIGSCQPPNWCINSWKINYVNKYPEWKYILWTEKELNNLEMVNREIYNKEPTLRGKSDIARLEILYKYGGIFLDADSIWINNKNLEILLKEAKDFSIFCALEPDKLPKFIANGVIGSKPRQSLMLDLINHINKTYTKKKSNNSHPYSIWKVTGPLPLNNIFNCDNIKVFPSFYFFPEGFVKGNINFKIDDIRKKFPNSFMYQYWLSHYN